MKVDEEKNLGDAVVDRETERGSDRWKTTLVIEAEPNDFEEALKAAVAAARERFISVSFTLKTAGSPRIECRTTKVRRRKERTSEHKQR